MRRFHTLVLLTILALGVCSLASAVTTTWPQAFSLQAGQTARYSFEVASEGQIVVDATWQTSGLTMLLADPSGSIVNMPPTVVSSPTKLLYTATAADLQKGKEWTLTIYPPPTPAPSTKPVAVGTISVTVPVPGLRIVPGLGGIGPIRQLPGTPSIQTITPNYGSVMDIVIVKGKNIPEDKTMAEVSFELGGSTRTPGTIISASKSLDGTVTYQVRVPGNDYLYNSHQGPFYVKVKATGAMTNTLPFTFDPCPRALITGNSPQYGMPGAKTTFTGTHFKSNDEVYFIIPGQGTVKSPSVDHTSSTQMAAVLPSNYPKDKRPITVYVRSQCKTQWFDGPQYNYALDPAYINSKP